MGCYSGGSFAISQPPNSCVTFSSLPISEGYICANTVSASAISGLHCVIEHGSYETHCSISSTFNSSLLDLVHCCCWFVELLVFCVAFLQTACGHCKLEKVGRPVRSWRSWNVTHCDQANSEKWSQSLFEYTFLCLNNTKLHDFSKNRWVGSREILFEHLLCSGSPKL